MNTASILAISAMSVGFVILIMILCVSPKPRTVSKPKSSTVQRQTPAPVRSTPAPARSTPAPARSAVKKDPPPLPVNKVSAARGQLSIYSYPRCPRCRAHNDPGSPQSVYLLPQSGKYVCVCGKQW